MNQADAMMLRFKALKCLREGQANPCQNETANRFALLAIDRLCIAGYADEAMLISEKILDNNCQ